MTTIHHSQYMAKLMQIPPLSNKRESIPNYCCVIYILNGQGSFSSPTAKVEFTKSDFILCNNLCNINIKNLSSNEEVEYMIIAIKSATISAFSTTETNLNTCFDSPNQFHHVRSKIETHMLIKNLMKSLTFFKSNNGFGDELFQNASLAMLLVLVNKGFIEQLDTTKTALMQTALIDNIFEYIEENIKKDISLTDLENHFFVNKFHLSKEFKKHTGMTLHKYVIKRKLSYCKELIEKGLPIIEVYKTAGFGDYSHFIRTFKNEFNITPKQYYKQLQNKDDDK